MLVTMIVAGRRYDGSPGRLTVCGNITMSSRNEYRDDAVAGGLMNMVMLLLGGLVLFYVAGDNFGVFATLLGLLCGVLAGSLLLDLD